MKHNQVHGRVDFPSFTPAIFINMIIAISLDYGLFMLTRYREEVLRAQGERAPGEEEGIRSKFWVNLKAVGVATSRAGRVVFVSGVTLGLTNVGKSTTKRKQDMIIWHKNVLHTK